jgi:hypothetical protein
MKNLEKRFGLKRSRLYALILFALGFLAMAYMLGLLTLKAFGKGNITVTETLGLVSLVTGIVCFAGHWMDQARKEEEQDRVDRRAKRLGKKLLKGMGEIHLN